MGRFNHSYRLVIGIPSSAERKTNKNSKFTSSVDLDTSLQSSSSKTNAYELTTYQITFRIVKDNNTDPNKSSITIFNLKDDTVAYINNNIKNNLAIFLEVGYEGEQLVQVFKGTIQWISDTKDGATRRTELHCIDGGVNMMEAQTSRSYPKGTKYSTVVNDLVKDLGTPKGAIKISDDKTIPSSIALTGNTSHNLEHITKSIDHTFSIQDGAAYVMPQSERLPANSAYISEETGLIGSPQPFHNDIKPAKKTTKKTKSKKPKKPTDGVRFKCQINGTILPEKTVYLKSKNYDGAFKVISVSHEGDYEGNNWTSNVEAVSVSGIVKKS